MDSAAYRECRLCPRNCGVDRVAGKKGWCGETADCRVSFAGPHFGEEPSFSGTRGSGTIFFSGCSCGCFFCQNYQISLEHQGRSVSVDDLERMAQELIDAGVHNLNFVTADHFWPHVAEICRRLRARGDRTPFLYNCSGYQCPERVGALAAWMDIFLPDFKYAESALAAECMREALYPQTALGAIRRMVAEKGFLEPWDPSGAVTARRGVLVRHLVLPGQVENSRAALRLLHAEFGPDLPLAVMSQFRPTPACLGRGAFMRQVSAAEYEQVCGLVEELGFARVYIQLECGDDDFLPDFSREKPFRGNAR